MTTKEYDLNQTANNKVNLADLAEETRQSAVKVALDGIVLNAQNKIIFTFKAALDAADDTSLLAVVNQHQGLDEVEESTVQTDPDTGAVQMTPKIGPADSYEQKFETEWETSKLASIHEKDIDNQDIGWSSLEFYEDIAGVETLMVNPTQNDIDTKCIRTDLVWCPTVDYWVESGKIGHSVAIDQDIYVWARGSDGLGNYVFVEGGLNLRYLDAKAKTGVEGRAATHMPKIFTHPQAGDLIANKMRVVTRHPIGFQHRLQLLLGVYRLKDES